MYTVPQGQFRHKPEHSFWPPNIPGSEKNHMKKLIAVPLFLAFAAPAFAGTPVVAVTEPAVIAADATSSSNGASVMGLGLLLAVLIAAD